jgi:hexosaminidase
MQNRVLILLILVGSASLVTACAPAGAPRAPGGRTTVPPRHLVIPAPRSIELTPASTFPITPATVISFEPADERVGRIARDLSRRLGSALESAPAVRQSSEPSASGSIHLAIRPGNAALGEEGYELTIAADGIRISANEPAGLFYGVQTLRQLLPWSIEYEAARPRPIAAPTGKIVDTPRFAWRGSMLDVARHFFDVDAVKHYIDLIALYKVNRLHLHLSDDQGWRIEIKSWPNLSKHGGSTEVGGGPGGYYTQEQYSDLVKYAQDRFITIVPEIDMPGHTNAALASYPELNCDGKAPALYSGIEVGFSTLCVDKDVTYRFITDVVREIGALTPGPHFHVGGDEVEKLNADQFRQFIERVQTIVEAQGKQMIGWGDIAPARLSPTTLVQHWRPEASHVAAAKGAKFILSPASKSYLDHKYDKTTVLGLNWAGEIEVRTAYEWDPVTELPAHPPESIIGVEAPLWSETLGNVGDLEYMAFPRLPAAAEIGWSPSAGRKWEDFSARLAGHGPRLTALGVNFYRSPQVPWP